LRMYSRPDQEHNLLMRAERSVLWVFLSLLIAGTAAAQSLTVAPSSIFVNDVETFVSLRGDHLLGNVATEVVYSGPAGTFTVEPSAGNPEFIEAAGPFEVATTVGHYTITVNAIDDSGTVTSGPAGFDVIDRPQDGPPLLGLPESIFAEAINAGETGIGAFVDFGVSAINPDGSPADVTCNYSSGAFFAYGDTSVLCSATNSFGTSLGSFSIVVRDTTPPALTLPSDIFSTNPNVSYEASATDNVDGAVTINCTPGSGATFANGTTEVQCFADDSHDNRATGSFLVFVGATPPPPITVPGDIVTEATSAAGAAVTYTATTDANSTVSCVPPSGTTFPIGTLVTVQCTATNTLGISNMASFHVTVVDTTPPAIQLPSDITAQATNASGAVVSFTATATDVVDGAVAVNCFPASGSTFAVGTTNVQCSASDIRGNTSSGSFNVTVVLDNTPPVVSSVTASPSSLWPPNHQMANVTISVTATDNLDPSPVSQIVSISSNQPINGTGDGDVAPDWAITGPLTAQLRAERAQGNDRTYTITLSTCDFTGNCTTSTVLVKVTQSSSKSRGTGH